MKDKSSIDGWSQAVVNDVATLVRGITYKKEHSSNSPSSRLKPILRANNINGSLNFDNLVFVPTHLIDPEQYIRAGDIIFAMSSGSKHLVGKSARAITDFDGSYGAFCSLLRPSEEVDGCFLFYMFQENRFRQLVSEASKGSNINNLKREHILGFEFDLPPRKEQSRIVEKIEKLFSELDKGIESFKIAREQLKVYRQAVLKHAFEGKLTAQWREENNDKLESPEQLLARIRQERLAHFQQQQKDWKEKVATWEKSRQEGKKPGKPREPKSLTELSDDVRNTLPKAPVGWVWQNLGWMTCGVEYGTAAKSEEIGAVPVIRMGNLQNGRIDWEDLVFTSDDEEIGKYDLKPQDVLFNRTNSPELVGKTAIYQGERQAVFAGYLIRVNQIDSIVVGKYLNYFLNSHLAKQYGNSVKTDGVNQSNINGEKLQSYPFPYCSLDEQTQVINILEEKLSLTDNFLSEIDQLIGRSETLRQSILKKAFEGQLIPVDSND